MTDDEIARDMMNLRPSLIRFAKSMCGHDEDRSEDLASEAIARAWKHRGKFEPGTELRAWLFVILRNLFLSEQRRKRWDGGYLEDMPQMVGKLVSGASQEDYLTLKDVEKALRLIPKAHAEALLAVVFSGTYEEAAADQQQLVGTIKSRAGRARSALIGLLT